jgi:hypothetical protein
MSVMASDAAAQAMGVPFEHIMEGRKGEKSRDLAVYDWNNAV